MNSKTTKLINKFVKTFTLNKGAVIRSYDACEPKAKAEMKNKMRILIIKRRQEIESRVAEQLKDEA